MSHGLGRRSRDVLAIACALVVCNGVVTIAAPLASQTPPVSPAPIEPPPAPIEPPAAPIEPPAPADGPPELPPLTTEDPAAPDDAAGGPAAGAGTGTSAATAADALARGVAVHGYLQLHAAGGVRGELARDLVLFENRLQLDLRGDAGPVRITARPVVVHDGLADDVRVDVRELYAARFYDRLELAIGERIVTWGVTDFWPVVDLVNARDYRQLRSWRPIDEKLPAPVVQATAVLGRFTAHALGIVRARASAYQLDPRRPYAIPIAVPPEVPVEREEATRSLAGSAGGGAALDLALGSWKASLYALWGRNPLPTVLAVVDPAGAAAIRVESERVGMAAASAQGTIDALGALIKAEGALYLRADDRCEGATEVAPGTPSCFYLRRVPTARATAAIERELARGLTAHVQAIAEVTRRAAIPALPAAASALAPGLEPQHRINPIFTLRLQGSWLRDDLRPSVFIYSSIADEDWFGNLDLEYYLADGLAAALGVCWFEGFADPAVTNRFTLAGSAEGSSNLYLRATAWF